MPQSYTINPNQNRVIDAPVATLSVAVGEAIVTFPAPGVLPDDESQADAPKQESTTYTLQPDSDPLECNGQGNISVYSPGGASVSVIFEDEVSVPGAPATRGDSDGEAGGDGGGGSFESRTVKELRATAKERGLTGVSKLGKDDLIARLRGE